MILTCDSHSHCSCLSSILAQAVDAAVHEVAYTLVVDTHDAADFPVLEVLDVIEVYDLTLTGRELAEILLYAVGECRLTFHQLMVVFIGLCHYPHGGVVDLVVAQVSITTEFVVDAVAQ